MGVMTYKVKEIIKMPEDDGWQLDRVKGSHRQFVHPNKPQLGCITVAGHPSKDMPTGTAKAILKQAHIKTS
jgi:predicted RNA binding protein YcfA (HicA-like mRNA interferase family)